MLTSSHVSNITKQHNTKILFTNQLLRQIVHSGADRNIANLLTMMAISAIEMPIANSKV